MSHSLTGQELHMLIDRVFRPDNDDVRVAIFVDLPDETVPDIPKWRARRQLATDWAAALRDGPELSAVGGRPRPIQSTGCLC